MIEKPAKHMILTMVMLAPGCYKDSWRLPESRCEEFGYLDLAADAARVCEAAKLDALFIADVVSAATVLDGNLQLSGLNEPVTTLSALAAVTSKIGLTGTISTSFSLPFVTARQLAALDLISRGRAGWNIVASWMGNENFGVDVLADPEVRYRMAAEFVEVACALWDSWSDDAVINDRAGGRWADPERIRPIDFAGEYFQVAGPLNVPRPPQGRPVLFQAGQSGPGRAFAASVSDVVYSAAPNKEHALEFYRDIKSRVEARGRDPRSVKVVPGITPIVGETDAEAEEIARTLAEHINFDAGRSDLSSELRLRLDDIDLDETVPAERWEEHPPIGTIGSRYDIYRRLSCADGLTLRELIVERYRSNAHLWTVGSASRVADLMVDWFETGACDGFSFNPSFMLGSLERICTLLVPELRARGYFREEYEGSTLRDHLGLPRPGAWDRQEEAAR